MSGMHFSQAVAIIQSQVGVIKGVQVLYSDVVSILDFSVYINLETFIKIVFSFRTPLAWIS